MEFVFYMAFILKFLCNMSFENLKKKIEPFKKNNALL